jgi:hypothetical protein
MLPAHVAPSEPVSARRWNELVDALRAARLASDGSLRIATAPGGTLLGLAPRSAGIPIQNAAASSLPAFGVCRVTGLNTSWNGPPAFTVDQPDGTFRRNYLVNGPLELAPGQFGLAQRGPLVDVLYDSGTPALDEGWGPKPGQWSLSKHYPLPFTVLGLVQASAQRMLARHEPPSFLLGRISSNLAVGASGSVQVCESVSPGSEAEISGWTVTAWNRFASLTASSSAKKWVALNWINGRWYLVAAECS